MLIISLHSVEHSLTTGIIAFETFYSFRYHAEKTFKWAAYAIIPAFHLLELRKAIFPLSIEDLFPYIMLWLKVNNINLSAKEQRSTKLHLVLCENTAIFKTVIIQHYKKNLLLWLISEIENPFSLEKRRQTFFPPFDIFNKLGFIYIVWALLVSQLFDQ